MMKWIGDRWVNGPMVPVLRRANVRDKRVSARRREFCKHARALARRADAPLVVMKQYPSPNTSTHARDVAKQERRHALLLLAYLRGRPYSSQERETRVQWVPVPGLPPGMQRCVWHNRPSLERLAHLAADVMGGEPMYYVGDLAEWLREQ